MSPSHFHKRLARGAVTLFGILLVLSATYCGRPAAASAGAATASSPRVEGDRLILSPTDPQLATLATVAAVRAGVDSLRLPGRLAWNEDVTVRVFSPFGGRVVQVHGDVGARVHAQDTLALIASADYGQAQTDAQRASTDLSLAERTATRVHDLFDHGVAARKDVESADADLARARAERQRATSRLTLYGADSSAMDQVFVLRSPLSGTIVDRAVTPGQEVRSDQMLASAPQLFAPLFTVTNPSRLWVILDVPERDLPLVKAGTPLVVRANAWPGQALLGRLTLVGDAVDPNSRTVKLRATLDNPGGALKAEMLVTVTMPTPQSRGVGVPSGAVLLQGNDHLVFVDEGGGRFRRTAVNVGAEHSGTVAVLSGLAVGERVVTTSVPLVEQLFQNAKTGS